MARVAEVGGVSLPGAAHGTLSAQTRGPYPVRPWSCCWKNIPCFIQAAGERYPTHLDDADAYAESEICCPERFNTSVG